jgi:hypothetical protein
MRISRATKERSVRALIALAAVGLWSSVAAAGLLGTTGFAINDGGPDEGYWRGSVDFYKDAFINKVVGTLDWAVFAPGQFQLFLNDAGVIASDPTGGEQVVYAYQVVEVATGTSPGIGSVTVGLDSLDFLSTDPAEVLTSWAGEQPVTSAYPSTPPASTSAIWDFQSSGDNSKLITVGEISPLLVFGSPNAPQLDTFQVNSGLASFIGNTPSTMVGSPGSETFIIPEPGSIVLLMTGIVGFLLARRSAC